MGRTAVVGRLADGGATWSGPVPGQSVRPLCATIERLLAGGLTACSDPTVLEDRSIGVLWERGVGQPSRFLRFTRFGIDFLEAGVVGSR